MIEGQRRAYFATIDDKTGRWVLGIATEREPGYHRVKDDSDLGGSYESEAHANGVAKLANEGLGISPREAALIVASSIMVSDVKRDEGGIAKRPMRHRRKGK